MQRGRDLLCKCPDVPTAVQEDLLRKCPKVTTTVYKSASLRARAYKAERYVNFGILKDLLCK